MASWYGADKHQKVHCLYVVYYLKKNHSSIHDVNVCDMTHWVFIQVDFHLFIHLSHCLSFTSSFPNVQFSPLAYDSNYSLIIEPTIILFPWLQKHYFCVLKLCLCMFIVHANSCEPLKSVSVIDQRQVE